MILGLVGDLRALALLHAVLLLNGFDDTANALDVPNLAAQRVRSIRKLRIRKLNNPACFWVRLDRDLISKG